MFIFRCIIVISVCFFICLAEMSTAQNLPRIVIDKTVSAQYYLPDFSYAGYHFGEEKIQVNGDQLFFAEKYGVIPDDGLDDSKALVKLIDSLKSVAGSVILQLPRGRIILSDVLYIERSNFVIRGYGSGENGTEVYCPRPLRYTPDPEPLTELREYLVERKKRQREKENNIDLPFSQYSWSGGFFWTRVPGERVKPYLNKYYKEEKTVAQVQSGKMGEHILKVDKTTNINVGDVLELQLFNREGEEGTLVKDLYKNAKVKIGNYHWKYPNLPIVRQQIQVLETTENTITIKAPLTITVKPAYQARLITWKHLEEVGIERFKITFPRSSYVAHHVEMGFNGVFLTRLFNSWVYDLVIENADSGILSEEISNVTISDITTTGENKAHYSVALGSVHNVLVKNLKIYNSVIHPLSFNTQSTKNVYQNCEVFTDPVLDQHSGANHQNLFDNITVHIHPTADNSYPLFKGGGAGYWKPTAGLYSTFWNIDVRLDHFVDANQVLLLYGMNDGPHARVIGVHSSYSPLKIEYGPDAYLEMTNEKLLDAPSLYDYQLKQRLYKTTGSN